MPWKKFLSSLTITLICTTIIVVLLLLNAFEALEEMTLDVRFRNFPYNAHADSSIVLITIDEQSLRDMKLNHNPWPWSRDFYAVLTNYLAKKGASVIVFDILFPDPDIQRLSSDPEETDGKFANAMEHAGNVILATNLQRTELLTETENQFIGQRDTLRVRGSSPDGVIPQYATALLPIPLFQKNAAALGAANLDESSAGVICRAVPLLLSFRSLNIPHLGLAAYLRVKGITSIEFVDKRSLRIGGIDVPLDDHGNMLISWYGKGGPGGPFVYYSFGSILLAAVDELRGKTPSEPTVSFKDKIVIVGSNAAGLYDIKYTPLSSSAPYPGMEIPATVPE